MRHRSRQLNNAGLSHRDSLLYVKRIAALIPVFLVAVPAFAKTSCPLTEEQSQKAVRAFEKIAAFVLKEPRCVNCHGGVNPHIEGIGLDPEDPNLPASLVKHGGGLVRRDPADVNKGIMPDTCMDCHNHMANKRDGSPTKRWTTAAPFHNFVDKNATMLCRQFKRSTGSAQEFLGHLTDDNGGNNFAQTAFNGDRGLDPDQYLDPEGPNYVAPKPPSISHDAFIKLGQDWVNAMGGKFQGDESCGCEPTYDNWSGMITYVLDTKGDQGHEEWSDWSNNSLTKITVSVKDGVGTVRYSVQGRDVTQNRSMGWKGGAKVMIHASSTSLTSVDSTYPATAAVLIYQGTYIVTMGESWHSTIGKKHVENCNDMHGCQVGDLDVYTPTLPPAKGKVQDPNRIQNTFTQKKEGLGRSRKGVSIESTSVDLWRLGSN